MVRFLVAVAAVLAAPLARAQVSFPEQEVRLESPRIGSLEFKFGSYRPSVSEAADAGDPFDRIFGEDASMLLFEFEVERFFYQGFGSAGLAFSLGYAEKYGDALVVGGGPEETAGRTGFKVLPLHLHALYKLDTIALRWGFPLVPYAQGGVHYIPWWVTKGEEIEVLPSGERGRGGKWGYGATAGVQFLLDVLEPRLARDLDGSSGINHSYFFAEYSFENVDSFGGEGIDLSSRGFLFGLALDF